MTTLARPRTYAVVRLSDDGLYRWTIWEGQVCIALSPVHAGRTTREEATRDLLEVVNCEIPADVDVRPGKPRRKAIPWRDLGLLLLGLLIGAGAVLLCGCVHTGSDPVPAVLRETAQPAGQAVASSLGRIATHADDIDASLDLTPPQIPAAKLATKAIRNELPEIGRQTGVLCTDLEVLAKRTAEAEKEVEAVHSGPTKAWNWLLTLSMGFGMLAMLSGIPLFIWVDRRIGAGMVTCGAFAACLAYFLAAFRVWIMAGIGVALLAGLVYVGYLARRNLFADPPTRTPTPETPHGAADARDL